MAEALISGLSGLAAGVIHLHWSNVVMMIIGGVLLYLGIKKDCEPLPRHLQSDRHQRNLS